MRFIYTLFILLLLNLQNVGWTQDSLDYRELSSKILNSDNAEKKLIWSTELSKKLLDHLENSEEIKSLDSTALLVDLISEDKKVQIVTWGIEFDGKWEYFGLLKSYNQSKKTYQVYDLVSTDFLSSLDKKELFDQNNWPSGVYFKMIEKEYNKRKYYTFLGWLAPISQTSYKFIEVMTLSKSGKPYFRKTNYFKTGKQYDNRQLFSYSRQSKFLLDYGIYEYSTRKWNRKKKEYDIDEYSEELIVFDHLISQYPNMKDLPEFMVPVGNLIDAFKFDNGKWVYVTDIDARNMKKKEKKKAPPQLNLFDQSDNTESN